MEQVSILIVDDNYNWRVLLAGVMARKGYSCMEAATVAEAVELLSKYLFEVAILDLKLANGEGGLDVAKRLVAMDSKTKIIILSGFVNYHVVREAFPLNVVDVMSKSRFEVVGLLKVIEGMLSSSP